MSEDRPSQFPTSFGHGDEQPEVERLRAEVAELKELLRRMCLPHRP
jgi:hypothetical protein